MQRLQWRRSLALVAVLACLIGGIAVQPAAAQAVRKSVTALTPIELMSLRKGVTTMMARNSAPRNSADFRRSWVYWANMHAHFGNDCEGPIAGNGMTGVTLWTASNSQETATWCGCQHHNNQFLTWHRMYVYYFERVLREASGDPNLTLPYWDYATDRRLPVAFRESSYVNDQGQTVPNPLRVEARRIQLNNGSGQLAKSVVNSAGAMNATTYNAFRNRIESTPHGAIHCALTEGGCGNGLMGTAATAALDPIFYLHHSNIDRLYECWLKVNEAGRLPTGSAILNQQYSFVDADGSVVTRRVRDMLRTSQLGNYSYTAGAGCPAGTTEMVMVQGPTTLGRGETSVTIGAEGPGSAAAGAGAESAAPVAPERTATVHVAGLMAEQMPGVLFNVYIANPAGDRELIGVIDFFASGARGGRAHPAHGGRGGREFEFDATEAVAALGLEDKSRFRLIFEPSTGLESSTLETATEEIAPDANVTFRRAWLEWGE